MRRHFSKASLQPTHNIVLENSTRATFERITPSVDKQPVSNISSNGDVFGENGALIALPNSIHTLTFTSKKGETLDLFLARLDDTTLIEANLEEIQRAVQGTLNLMDTGGTGEELASAPFVVGVSADSNICTFFGTNPPQIA